MEKNHIFTSPPFKCKIEIEDEKDHQQNWESITNFKILLLARTKSFPSHLSLAQQWIIKLKNLNCFASTPPLSFKLLLKVFCCSRVTFFLGVIKSKNSNLLEPRGSIIDVDFYDKVFNFPLWREKQKTLPKKKQISLALNIVPQLHGESAGGWMRWKIGRRFVSNVRHVPRLSYGAMEARSAGGQVKAFKRLLPARK